MAAKLKKLRTETGGGQEESVLIYSASLKCTLARRVFLLSNESMGKALLINPSYTASYGGSKASIVNPIFPTLGLATIAAVADQKGHKMEILDLSYLDYDPKVIEEKIKEFKPDVVGVTATTPLVNQAIDISYIAKDISQSIKVVVGGAHVTAMPRETLNVSRIDAVVMGEGDYILSEILDGTDLKDVKGIFYRDGDDILFSGPRPVIKDLDSLPFPAWHLYDMDIYRKHLTKLYVKQRPAVKAEFSRGCIYQCNFCASKLTMGFGYRKKSPERVAEEVKWAHSLGIKEILVADDIFTDDKEWAMGVTESILKTNTKLWWSCTNGIRVESADLELFRLMKKSKCYRVFYGFESGADQVLKDFGKGGKANIEAGHRAVRIARQAGMDVGGYFMLGLTSETKETMKKTIDYATSLPLDLLKFSIAIPFPGTRMFNEYLKKDMIKSYDWDDYHMYGEGKLFTHENLTYLEIQDYLNSTYNKTMFLNPSYYARRFIRGVKTGELLSDAYYFVKFASMPSIRESRTVNYYAKEKWSQLPFIRESHKPSRPQKAGVFVGHA